MTVILWLNESVFSECGSQALNPADGELGEQSAGKLRNVLIYSLLLFVLTHISGCSFVPSLLTNYGDSCDNRGL